MLTDGYQWTCASVWVSIDKIFELLKQLVPLVKISPIFSSVSHLILLFTIEPYWYSLVIFIFKLDCWIKVLEMCVYV